MTTLLTPQNLIEKDLFEIVGLKHLSDQQKTDLLAKFLESVNHRVIVRILDEISQAKRRAFLELLSKGDESEITRFIEDQGISLETLATQEALALKAELISTAEKLQNKK